MKNKNEKENYIQYLLDVTESVNYSIYLGRAGQTKINKQNIKVWTYQMSRNPAASYKAETVFNVPWNGLLR